MTVTPSYPAWREIDDQPLTEADRVHLWREQQFRRMGYTDNQAFFLAGSAADLRFVARLLASGCSLELAFQIAT